MLFHQLLGALISCVALLRADFQNDSSKDFADILAELRHDHPIIVKAKDERVEVHSKLTNLASLLEEILRIRNSGQDIPEDDEKVRDELTSAAQSIRRLDDYNEELIAYGRNLSCWFEKVAAAYYAS
ncbi:hypothetical protein L798_08543 [Zootermopsis nevadensis]|uniref:Uncharacterized protein n=1 Tax=Zootermopsis nevadensis TaxID=136037 RepID=A0A067R2U9_ZOONE|nr:hypothetical protein L798_08543 [Zootermopsis nevadensis]